MAASIHFLLMRRRTFGKLAQCVCLLLERQLCLLHMCVCVYLHILCDINECVDVGAKSYNPITLSIAQRLTVSSLPPCELIDFN